MEDPMPPTKPRPASAVDQAAVLTKATLRAATQLGLTNKLLATVIGVSEATVSRMRSGDYTLQRGQKPFELAVLFVRLYRSLDAIVGGDDAVAGSRLKNRDAILGSTVRRSPKPLARPRSKSFVTHRFAIRATASISRCLHAAPSRSPSRSSRHGTFASAMA